MNAADLQPPTERILGIDFFLGTLKEAVEAGFRGGLLTAPSAPVLCAMREDAATRAAIEASDLILPDSGLMVGLWKLMMPRTRLRRLSGLRYIEALVRSPRFRSEGGALWVMPSETSREINLKWLNAMGVATSSDDCYVAPHYPAGPLSDTALLEFIEQRLMDRKRHLVMAIGGGVQERLGHFVRKAFGRKLCIHCIGGAIGFLSGDQAPIPMWADRLYLGWLLRCLNQPGRFIPRYWRSARLIPMMLWHRSGKVLTEK